MIRQSAGLLSGCALGFLGIRSGFSAAGFFGSKAAILATVVAAEVTSIDSWLVVFKRYDRMLTYWVVDLPFFPSPFAVHFFWDKVSTMATIRF